ncbi:MAG: outer membrane beta-barrel protein [Bacteroidota bacterium]
MKRLLFLIFLLPAILHGQNSTSIKNRKFFIGVNFSPDYSYRFITKNDKSISSDQWTHIKNLEDSIYKPSFGFTTGLNFYYQINKLLSIETGFQYSHKGYQTIPFPTVYDFNYDPAIATNYIYFTYLDFPLRVNFTFLKSKLQIITSAGAVFNYLLQTRSKTVPETPTANFQTQINISKYHYNKINISPTVSLGLKYNINKRINLRAEPTFRYGLLNTDSKSYAFTHLWSAGLNISFNYGF